MRAGVAAVLVLTGAAAMPAAAADLQCTLRAPAKAVAGQPVRLVFTLTNRGASPLRLLEWNTPFEGWFAPYVTVARDGGAVPYGGPAIKRGDPSADEYFSLAAGGARRAEVDLALPFDLSVPGRYVVTPHLTLFDQFAGGAKAAARPRDAHVQLALPCNPIEVEIVAGPARRP
jgi:hypothetical protein